MAVAVFVKELFGEEFDLTGPQALDHALVAQKITRVIGREIAYHAIDEIATLQGARQSADA